MVDWRADAACLGVSGDVFFPTDGHMTVEAERLCARCSVNLECLLDDLSAPVTHRQGIRAGLTEQGRRRLDGRLCQSCGREFRGDRHVDCSTCRRRDLRMAGR